MGETISRLGTERMCIMIIAKINVYLAYLLGNLGGKRVDIHGRKYRDVYKRFGNLTMARDFLQDNSWFVKKRVGLI